MNTYKNQVWKKYPFSTRGILSQTMAKPQKDHKNTCMETWQFFSESQFQGFSVKFFRIIIKNTLQEGDSISILEKHDSASMKEMRFPLPPEMLLNEGQGEKTVHKFIRDCVACLQACFGSSNIILGPRKICDKVPSLKDPRPPSFF